MANLKEEYGRLLDKQSFGELDYSILERHIETLTRFCAVTSSAITVFDSNQRKTVFESEGYKNLFGDELDAIHPDDQEGVLRSGVIALRYFFDGNKMLLITDLCEGIEQKLKVNTESWWSKCSLWSLMPKETFGCQLILSMYRPTSRRRIMLNLRFLILKREM